MLPRPSYSVSVDTKLLAPVKGTFAKGYESGKVAETLLAVTRACGLDFTLVWQEYRRSDFVGYARLAIRFDDHVYACQGAEPLGRFLRGAGPCPKSLTITLGGQIPVIINAGSNCAMRMIA